MRYGDGALVVNNFDWICITGADSSPAISCVPDATGKLGGYGMYEFMIQDCCWTRSHDTISRHHWTGRGERIGGSSPMVGTGHWLRSSGALLPAAMCCWSWLLGHNTRYCSLQLTPAHAIINTNHLLHSLSDYTWPLYTNYKLTVNQVSMAKWLMAYECTYLSTDINQNGWEDTEYFNS